MAESIVLMGVSGCGKTTVGQLLAERLDWTFHDGDDFHPEANVRKMASGRPLDDQDRAPWLARLRQLIESSHAEGTPIVLACSALKASYRRQLISPGSDARLVLLKGSFELLHDRMISRPDHFMPPGLLASQLETLEEPADDEALKLDVRDSPAALVEQILSKI